MKSEKIKIYPFTALVGQERMKKALILNAINPELGGVLIRGEKGTAKSTAVRGLAELLPEFPRIAGCPFSCPPGQEDDLCSYCQKEEQPTVVAGKMKVVDLPVSATEDMVVGSLDIEQAIKKGEKKFEPGILARANRNILYVDEVNLLDDHLVDILLDSAAMGVNTIEREGISFSHPARFILVGTMNPEEGELRPQLLDRFALSVEVRGEQEASRRIEIVKRRMEFEADPAAFIQQYSSQQQKLAGKIMRARENLSEVSYDEQVLELTATITTEIGVDGHRADINIIKTAVTIAAFAGRDRVLVADIGEAAEFVLPHRVKRRPFTDEKLKLGQLQEIIASFQEEN